MEAVTADRRILALTILQPWATLIAQGPKRVEIRATGPGVVTAGDITETNGIEILVGNALMLALAAASYRACIRRIQCGSPVRSQ